MKSTVSALFIATCLAMTQFQANAIDRWKTTDAYTVRFSSKKMQGEFKGLKSQIEFDDKNPEQSKIKATIESATIETGNNMKNNHARKALGSEEYPTIQFESTQIKKDIQGYIATGKLTIKQTTKEIIIPFHFNKTNLGGVFTGQFTIQPEEYQVTRMGTPKSVTIELNIPVIP